MNHAQKRILSILAATAMTCCALPQGTPLLLRPVITASADDSVLDDLLWEKMEGNTGIKITGYNGTADSLVIPDTIEDLPVTVIGSWAFWNKTALVSITLPDSITEIENNAFNSCSGLNNINMPESLKLIGNTAFSSCAALEAVVIPDGVTDIGNSAFAGCSKLTNITIPESVTSIGENAFRNTKWLGNMQSESPYVVVNSILIDATTCTDNDIFPNTVTSIGNLAFALNNNITSITIPDSVTHIGNQAFSQCRSLTDITIPNSVTSFGSSVFNECTELTSVTLPDSLTVIESGTFNKCSKLTSVTLPSGMTSIAATMFSDCSSLTDVVIPDSVTKIDGRAFFNCVALTNLALPESLAAIDFQAFYNCKSLEQLTIPADVTIGASAFGNCPKLTIFGEVGSAAETAAQNSSVLFRVIGHEDDAGFTGASLTLTDSLGLNFYIDKVTTEEEAAAYSVKFSGKCEEDGQTVALIKKNDLFCATANVTAVNRSESITATLLKDGETVSSFTYSVTQYLNTVDTTGNDALRTLVTETDRYCSVSYYYFSTMTYIPSVADRSEYYYTDAFAPVKNTGDGIALVLNSRLAARLYVDGLQSGAEAAYGDETLTARKDASGKYFFEVTGISPTMLADDIVISYEDFDYKFKPLSWSYLVANKGDESSEKNKAMANALYGYYAAAAAYAAAQ